MLHFLEYGNHKKVYMLKTNSLTMGSQASHLHILTGNSWLSKIPLVRAGNLITTGECLNQIRGHLPW